VAANRIRQLLKRILPKNLPRLGRVGADGPGRQKYHPSCFHVSPQFLALHCLSPLVDVASIVMTVPWETPRMTLEKSGKYPTFFGDFFS
jgi:hypothetical protein